MKIILVLKKGDNMIIEQQKIFNELGFKEYEFDYPTGKGKCYKGSDGGYYRIDHFEKAYVIEYAENEKEAKLNQFEDADLYDDGVPIEKLIESIQADLKNYMIE